MHNRIRVYLFILIAVVANVCLAKEQQHPTVKLGEDQSFQAYQHFVNGDLLELSGNLKAAVEEYRAALRLNPALHEARYHLAQILFKLRDVEASLEQALLLPMETIEQLKLVAALYNAKQIPQKAREYYQKVVEKDSADINSLYALVQLYHRDNQIDSASFLLRKISGVAPPNSQTHQQIAEYYFRLGRLSEAISEYQRAIDLDSSNSQAYAGLGLAYESQKDLRKALDTYLVLQSQLASNVLLSQKLIGLYYNLNFLDSAIAQARTAAELFPNEISLKKLLGSLYFAQRNYAQAESLFKGLLKANQNDEDAILHLGRIDLLQKNYAGAEARFRQVLSINDTLMDAWFSLASTYIEQGKYSEADSLYQESIARSSDTVSVYLAKGIGYGRAKKYFEAEKSFRVALEVRPKDAGILLALGNLHQQQGQNQVAEKYFSQVLDQEPDHPVALNNLGYLWAEQGVKLDKSLEMIERALKQEPNNAAFLDSYGWILFKLGRLVQAEEYLKKAQEMLPTDPEVHHHLGDLYHSQGKSKLALQSWQKALELDPDNQKLKQKLGSSKKISRQTP